MRWTYDMDANALYMRMSDAEIASQRELEDGTIVDLDEKGDLVGLDLVTPAIGFDWMQLFESYGIEEADRVAIVILMASPLLGRRRQPRLEDVTFDMPTSTSTPIIPILATAA